MTLTLQLLILLVVLVAVNVTVSTALLFVVVHQIKKRDGRQQVLWSRDEWDTREWRGL